GVGLQRNLLPRDGSARGHPRSIRHLCRRILCTPFGWPGLGARGRPHRTQTGTRLHSAPDRTRHLFGRSHAYLQHYRHLGCRHPCCGPTDPGVRCRGEQGGAILLTAEASPPNRRGFFASFVQLGSPVAYLIPTVLFAWLMGSMNHEAFIDWGWRIPFLLSIIVVAIGLYIRTRVPESKTFQEVKEKQVQKKAPLAQLMTNNRREIFGGLFTKFVEAAVFPFYTVFLVTYADNSVYESQIILDAVIVAIICEIITIPLLGKLTDRAGRKPVYMAAAILNLVLIWPAFLAVESENFAVITALLVAGLALGHSGSYAPHASFFPELFPAQARYSGVSVVWQFGSMVASGPFTVVATALLVLGNGSYLWAALYVAVLVITSIIAIQFLPETAPVRRGGREYAVWGESDNDNDRDIGHAIEADPTEPTSTEKKDTK